MISYVVLVCLLVCVHCAYDRSEGTRCTYKGAVGTCVNIYRCLSYMEPSNREDVDICSFQDSEPVICCTDCDIVEKKYRVLEPHGVILSKTGQKAWDKCLDYIQLLPYACHKHYKAKIQTTWNEEKKCFRAYPTAVGAAGGSNAAREEYPHMALLGYGSDVDGAQWLCGGTLISDRFILTAGHCISSPRLGQVSFVALGILKRTDPPSYWRRYRVERIITHPDYKPPSKYHDIALLETDTIMKFDSSALPACLPIHHDLNYTSAFATGWGALGRRRELADTLQAVFLNKFSDEECSFKYPRHRHLRNGFDSITQVCYGHRKVIRDTCQGDSGGPLQISGEASSCVYTILGVTSTGKECGDTDIAGIYTRVFHYVPWIESIVWP